MDKAQFWNTTAVKIALISSVVIPLLVRPLHMLTGAEELSVDNFIAWTVGALGYLALMGLIYFIVVLTSAPDR